MKNLAQSQLWARFFIFKVFHDKMTVNIKVVYKNCKYKICYIKDVI